MALAKNPFSEIDAPKELIYIMLPKELCLKQIDKQQRENTDR